jgi:hypothetical protein
LSPIGAGPWAKWGGVFRREKWDSEGYAAQTPDFVKGVKDGIVQWGYQGQRTADAAQNISVDDVRWVLRYLGRITDAQLRAGLQASGATSAEITTFVPAIRNRINQLRAVARTNPASKPIAGVRP